MHDRGEEYSLCITARVRRNFAGNDQSKESAAADVIRNSGCVVLLHVCESLGGEARDWELHAGNWRSGNGGHDLRAKQNMGLLNEMEALDFSSTLKERETAHEYIAFWCIKAFASILESLYSSDHGAESQDGPSSAHGGSLRR